MSSPNHRRRGDRTPFRIIRIIRDMFRIFWIQAFLVSNISARPLNAATGSMGCGAWGGVPTLGKSRLRPDE
jgi:hypothetical protein